MCAGNRRCKCLEGATEAPPPAPTQGHTPFMPMQVMNGFLTAAPNRSAPQTDINHAPRLWRRYVDASGFEHVQLNNGMQRRQLSGLNAAMAAQSNFLSTIVPIIPGQTRDNWGGFQPKGMDPQSYAALVANGPGSQPVNPGGVGMIAAGTYINPYAGGG